MNARRKYNQCRGNVTRSVDTGRNYQQNILQLEHNQACGDLKDQKI